LRSLRLLCLAENTSAAQTARQYRPHVRSRPQPSASDRFGPVEMQTFPKTSIASFMTDLTDEEGVSWN
jgi:hypothetical protein